MDEKQPKKKIVDKTNDERKKIHLQDFVDNSQLTTVEIIIIIMMIHHQQQQQANWPGQMSMEFMFYPPKNKTKKQN